MIPIMRRALLPVLAMSLSGMHFLAQQTPASSEGFGTVTGHIYCADNGRPARFAQAILMAVPRMTARTTDPALMAKDPDATLARSFDAAEQANLISAQADFDGVYASTNVVPGDYYLFASVPGYIQPYNMVRSMLLRPEDNGELLSGVPVVHVAADRTVNADVSAIRGATVSGTVAWE